MTTLRAQYSADPIAGWSAVQELLLMPPVDAAKRKDIVETCDGVVRRIKDNLTVIVDRLIGSGYEFWSDGTPLTDPPSDIEDRIQALRQTVECTNHQDQPCPPLSPLLESWFRNIGSVDLTGYCDSWPAPMPKIPADSGDRFMTDAFQFYPIEEVIADLRERIADGDTCTMAFSSDRFHKLGVSGGSRYQIDIWSYDIDPFLFEMPKEQRMVPYLRDTILSWGGLPGFRLYKNAPKSFLREITKDLLAF